MASNIQANYLPEYASGEADESIKAFISRFYEVSDDPNQNETWVEFFKADAKLIMGTQVAKGRDGSYLAPAAPTVGNSASLTSRYCEAPR